MNNETVISWTVTNWITVFLMVLGGILITGGISALVSKGRSGKGKNND